jgi:site-specific recombinase XerD
MIDAMVVRGYAKRTQEAYVCAVAGLARYHHRSPDLLDMEQVQQYQLYMLRERQRSTSTVNQAGSAFKFFYGTVLGRPAQDVKVPLARTPRRLPELLSREELARLFAAVRSRKAETFLKLAYATGLRLNELCHLRVRDVDSHSDRMCIRVDQGKGGKDRYVPLSDDALRLLRQWLPQRARNEFTHRSPWVFAAAADPAQPLPDASPQRWYRAAARTAGIDKIGGIHGLRHCWATHLVEAGVDLYTLQQWMGHSHISTTTRYLHLARPGGALRADVKLGLLSALPEAPPDVGSIDEWLDDDLADPDAQPPAR